MIDSAFANELTTDELDRVVGGIIIVGCLPQLFHQASALDRVALNPQPLPPRILSVDFGH
jgi:hypothetical protein